MNINKLVVFGGRLFLLVEVLWLGGCKGFQRGKQLGDQVSQHSVLTRLSANPADSVRFYFSGCAGFFIRRGPDALLTDPFLSNNGPMTALMFNRLLPDSARLASYTRKILGSPTDTAGVIKMLTATHTHYDHIYDIPALYHRNLNRDSLLLVGSESFRRLMHASEQNYGQPIRQLRTVDSLVSSADTLRNWIYSANGRLRILPIRSYHAPHFYGIKLYKGTIRRNLRQVPERANNYKEGLTLAYYVDFLNAKGQSDFRIYIQGSANQVPLGLPPKLPDNKTVDVAIICLASYAYVRHHPEATLDYLKPRLVILSHWENFFQPGAAVESRPAVVPFSSARVFMKRFRRHHERDTWVLPQPGIWITVQF